MTRCYNGLIVATWPVRNEWVLQVEVAPDPLLLPLWALQVEHLWRIQGGRIWVGVDLTTRPATYDPVWYQITGLDAAQGILTLNRCLPDGQRSGSGHPRIM